MGCRRRSKREGIYVYIIADLRSCTSLVAQMVKVSANNVGDSGSIPVLGRSPGVGNGNPLQYFCLENPVDREDRQAIAPGVTNSQIQS